MSTLYTLQNTPVLLLESPCYGPRVGFQFVGENRFLPREILIAESVEAGRVVHLAEVGELMADYIAPEVGSEEYAGR